MGTAILSTYVLDASVALAWHFEDQANDETLRMLTVATQDGAIVPSHWALDVSSALILSMRVGKTTDGERQDFMRVLLDEAQIEMDTLTHSRAGLETLDIAREHGLSSYDAAYVELARRRNVPLATRDRRLAAAARAAGVTTIEP